MGRILVVEDEIVVSRSIAKLLTAHGHEVPRCTTSGESAIALAAELRPDLILMDIHLSGSLDGAEAATQIRAASEVPIIFLTAYADRDHIARAKLADPHAYLIKPFTDRELLTTVEITLHRGQRDRAAGARDRWIETMLRSISDGVIAFDADQRIAFVNNVAERLTGWTEADARGRTAGEVLNFIDEHTRAPRQLPIAAAVAERSVHSVDAATILVSRTGHEFPVDASVAALGCGDGGTGGVVVFRDVSERRSLEARLESPARMASLATLTAGIGHELNNPLSYNLGNLALVISELPDLRDRVERLLDASPPEHAAPVRAGLETIEHRLTDAAAGAERMRDVIGSLSELSRPDQGPHHRVALVACVDTALRLTANQINQRGSIVREVRAEPIVMGHEGRLTQVFANLLTNAAQALPDQPGSAGAIRVVIDALDDDAVIEVIDTGVGIPVDRMLRIFEPFYTTQPAGFGTGIGLAVADRIVKSHGGDITVRSQLGTGSTFRVRLPLAPGDEIAPPPPSAAAGDVRRSVLIVDDDGFVARLFRRVLEPLHDVRLAGSGREALALIADRVPDVVICDLMMPEMSGIDLHRAIQRSHAELADRFLFVTGGAFTPRAQQFAAEMGDRVLHKPLRPHTLLAAVARVVR